MHNLYSLTINYSDENVLLALCNRVVFANPSKVA